MPAWKATDFSSAEVIGSDSRTTTGGGGRLRGLLVDRRGRDRGAAAVWRGPAAADADRRRSVRSRISRRERALDARRSAGLEVSDARVAAAVLRPGRSARSAPFRACQDVAWASALPLDFFDAGGVLVTRSSATRRSTTASGRRTEYQVVSPTYFSTLDLPIVAGRAFDRATRATACPSAS